MNSELKYRRLSSEELSHLEKEFIDFLVLNGILAEDWEKMKNEDPDKSLKMIEIFSDMIIEGSLLKTEFLEFVAQKKMASIHFQKDQMVLVVMEAPADSQADFTNAEFIQQATSTPPDYLSISTKTLPYINPREKTMWDYSQNGWYVSNGALYKSLCLGL